MQTRVWRSGGNPFKKAPADLKTELVFKNDLKKEEKERVPEIELQFYEPGNLNAARFVGTVAKIACRVPVGFLNGGASGSGSVLQSTMLVRSPCKDPSWIPCSQ